METKDFLTAVLPTQGHYCVAQFNDKSSAHAFSTTVDAMLPTIQQHEANHYCTFFALSTFADANSRTVANAAFIRALFLDLDCGAGSKVYATKKDALNALSAFLSASGLPTPWLVSSGNGVHAYWPLAEDASIAEWKPVAENLKRLCAQHDLRIDHTVTADAARVLRVPGTHNWKKKNVKPLPCVVKHSSTPTHFALKDLAATILQTLKEPVSAKPVFDIPGTRLTATTPSLIAGADNRVSRFRQILKRTEAGTGCGQLAHYLLHAAEDGVEPLWRGMLSLAKVCVDGDKAAKFLSNLHPYIETRMHTKLRGIKGPYPCTKLDSENPGICPQCPYWGKITNPLVFGHEVQVDKEEKVIEAQLGGPTEPAQTIVRPTPPRGYSYGRKGGIYREVEEEDADGKKMLISKLVIQYDLFVVDLLNDEEGHYVQLMAQRPEGAVEVIIPQRAVVSKEETIKALAERNIMSAYGSGNDKHLFDYVRACTEKASSARSAIVVPKSYGWQKDDSFVLNSTVYTPTGEKRVPIPKLTNISSITNPSGSMEKWLDVWNLVISKEHYDVLSMALVGFGSVLMKFTGFTALTFHIGSSESGTGKSLSLNMARSVWGNEHYIMNPSTSAVTQEHRAGALGSLPLIVDEITEVNEDFKWVAKFIMDMTSGTGKDRMKAATNEERLNTTYWNALMLLASNTHLTDFFTGVRKKESRGHLRRVLETKMETVLTWTPEEDERIGTLRDNYGHAGRRFAQWLVNNLATVKRVVREEYVKLRVELRSTGDERFWIAGCAANIAAGKLLGRNYANIISLPMAGITESYKKLIRDARGQVKASVRNSEDILNGYTREFFGQFIVVVINDETKKWTTSYGTTGAVDKSITRSQVKGRVEHDKVPGHVIYYIEEALLKAWCSQINYGYADFRAKLENEFIVSVGKKDMLSGTPGPQMRVNCVQITRPLTAETEAFEAAEEDLPVA